MKKILYIVAPQNPEDIDYVCRHAVRLSRRLQRKSLDEFQFGALLLMNHPVARNSGVVAVRGRNDDPTVFLPFRNNVSHFKRALTGYSYIFNTAHISEDSIFNAYKQFSQQEGQNGVDLNTTYQIVCFDFRTSAGKFLGNDSDLMVEDMSRYFRNRIGLHVLNRMGNTSYYNFSSGGRHGEYLLLISNQRTANIMQSFPFEDQKIIKANIDLSINEIIKSV